MTDKEKQEIVRNVAIAIHILIIAGVIGFFSGAWFLALCFIVVAWPVEKMIERVFRTEVSSATVKMDAFFDAVYKKVEPTWFGRFLDKVCSFPPAVANDLREETEVGPVAASDISTRPSSVSAQSDTRGIFGGLGGSISSEFLEFKSELEIGSEYDDDDDVIELKENNLPSMFSQESKGSDLRSNGTTIRSMTPP